MESVLSFRFISIWLLYRREDPMANALNQIEHIVVLMQENRSFDNMLGWQFGLDPKYFNLSDQGEPIHVWGKRDSNAGYATMTIPDPDPGELFTDMNYQLFEDYF